MLLPPPSSQLACSCFGCSEEGKEGGRKEGREGGREKEGGREGGEGGRKREGGREGEREVEGGEKLSQVTMELQVFSHKKEWVRGGGEGGGGGGGGRGRRGGRVCLDFVFARI